MPRRNKYPCCLPSSRLLVTVWDEIRVEMKRKDLETFIVWQSNFISIECDDKTFGLIFCMISLNFVFPVIYHYYRLQKNWYMANWGEKNLSPLIVSFTADSLRNTALWRVAYTYERLNNIKQWMRERPCLFFYTFSQNSEVNVVPYWDRPLLNVSNLHYEDFKVSSKQIRGFF